MADAALHPRWQWQRQAMAGIHLRRKGTESPPLAQSPGPCAVIEAATVPVITRSFFCNHFAMARQAFDDHKIGRRGGQILFFGPEVVPSSPRHRRADNPKTPFALLPNSAGRSPGPSPVRRAPV